jgi:uncharacterized membrane protein YgcG
MSRRVIFFGFLCLALLAASLPARAQTESIRDFHSDVTLKADGTMQVIETIRVYSTNRQIRHGIYRDFPTTYSDQLGNRYVVGFHVFAATLDGFSETFRLQPQSNGQRVYLGDPKFIVSVGEHTYTIAYATNQQLGFFPDHDELFWNVTGNGWLFAIERASATLHLPANIPADAVKLSGFTGRQGFTARNLTSATNEDGTFTFSSSKPLRPYEGLTVLLTWPKGFIAAPTQQQKFHYFLENNPDFLFITAGFVLLLLYYLLVWLAVGRDPARGVIMPLYEPPANLSPAAMRYLVRMGFDNKAFTAAILNLAVKGYLLIKEQAGSYTLYLSKNTTAKLSPDETAVAAKLFEGRNEIWLHNENHTTISGAISSLKAWLKTAEEQIYFFTNSRYMWPAVFITAVALVGAVFSRPGVQLAIPLFLTVWLSIWSLALAGLIAGVLQSWKSAFAGGHIKSALIGKSLLLTVFALPFLGGEVMGLFFFSKTSSLLAVLFLVSSIFIHLLFHYLLKAPTSAGRRLLDQVEGFKLFLGAVDGDRLDRIMPPDQTPQTFEKYLPYALALDVEQAWTEKFSAVLASASQISGNNSHYSPAWYSGPGWSTLGAAGFASSMGSSFNSAISSSASAPGSSGGGGSGGSGGGGGGGGGGGW